MAVEPFEVGADLNQLGENALKIFQFGVGEWIDARSGLSMTVSVSHYLGQKASVETDTLLPFRLPQRLDRLVMSRLMENSFTDVVPHVFRCTTSSVYSLLSRGHSQGTCLSLHILEVLAAGTSHPSGVASLSW